jgi:hypothetical protein
MRMGEGKMAKGNIGMRERNMGKGNIRVWVVWG